MHVTHQPQHLTRSCPTVEETGRQQDVSSWCIFDPWLACPYSLWLHAEHSCCIRSYESALYLTNAFTIPFTLPMHSLFPLPYQCIHYGMMQSGKWINSCSSDDLNTMYFMSSNREGDSIDADGVSMSSLFS